MKTDISEKKPAGADFSAKDSAKNPGGKPAGKKPTTSRSGSRVTAKSFAGKPASRLKSGEATAGKTAGKRVAFSAKKPARKFAGHSAGKFAGNPTEESAWKPAEKYTGKKRTAKPAWKSAEGKPHAGKTTAANSAAKNPAVSRSGSRTMAKPFAGKPASRLKSGEATAPAETPAASRSGGTAKTREYPAKVKEPKTTRADGAAKSTPAAKNPKASSAEQKPIATAPAVPADETAFLKTLGLAARARQTVMGTDMVCDALAEGRVRLVVEAGDTSENTHKRLTDKCITYRTPHVRLLSDGGTLGAALGKSGALAVCGVTGEIARSLFSAWERLTASAPAVPEKVAKTKK